MELVLPILPQDQHFNNVIVYKYKNTLSRVKQNKSYTLACSCVAVTMDEVAIGFRSYVSLVASVTRVTASRNADVIVYRGADNFSVIRDDGSDDGGSWWRVPGFLLTNLIPNDGYEMMLGDYISFFPGNNIFEGRVRDVT